MTVTDKTLVEVAYFFFQAEDGIRDYKVTGVQTCALPIYWAVFTGAMYLFGTWCFARCMAGRYGVSAHPDRKSTRLNSSHLVISYAVFCLKKKKNDERSFYLAYFPP